MTFYFWRDGTHAAYKILPYYIYLLYTKLLMFYWLLFRYTTYPSFVIKIYSTRCWHFFQYTHDWPNFSDLNVIITALSSLNKLWIDVLIIYSAQQKLESHYAPWHFHETCNAFEKEKKSLERASAPRTSAAAHGDDYVWSIIHPGWSAVVYSTLHRYVVS